MSESVPYFSAGLNLVAVPQSWLVNVRMVFMTGMKDTLLTGNSALQTDRAADLNHVFRTIPFY